MKRITTAALLLAAISCGIAATAQEQKADDKPAPDPKTAAITPAEADADFKLQGEYSGQITEEGEQRKLGVQIIALGGGKFRAVGYPGGLPGDGWNQKKKVQAEGELQDNTVTFTGDKGKGVLRDGQLTVSDADGNELGKLAKVIRKSPTLGQKPPEGAVVLFDGTSADNFDGGRLSDDGLLMEGCTSKQKFGSFQLHLEFMLSYMPYARGQGRSNSGVYMQGRYEVQVLDSFGLEGKDNEAGGIYSIKDPDLNMCFPPLSWQTYDVDYTAAKFDAEGKKTENARMTVRHNGVVIHENVELPKTTTAAPVNEGPDPGPIYIQNHGNPLRFRNIWLVEKKAEGHGPRAEGKSPEPRLQSRKGDDAGSRIEDGEQSSIRHPPSSILSTRLASFVSEPAPASEQAAPCRTGYGPLLFFDNFECGTADGWLPSDPNAWRVERIDGGYVYNQFQASKVKTPTRSPFNRSMIRDVNVGNFLLDVKVRSTIKDYPHRDICLFFGYQDPGHLYYVHLGKRMDDHANNIFIVNDAPRLKISTKTTAGTDWDDEWHHVRVTRNVDTGAIDVYFDDLNNPVMTAVDKTFTWGQVGVGSFDDTGHFDNVFLFGDAVEPYPDFEPLFDGRTLDGWHTNPEKIGHGTGGRWTVENGAITGEQDPPGSGNGGILLTDQKFGDFELVIDMNHDFGPDSGLFLRSTEKGQCFQMMVDYHDNGNVGHIYGEGVGGFNTRPFDIFGVYDENKRLTALTTRPVENPSAVPYTITAENWLYAWKVNDWNTARVRVVGSPPRITTWINGWKVIEFDGGAFSDPKYDKEKVAGILGDAGHIAVQVHGGKGAWPEGMKCRWRNIKIKRLD